jgi:hypothetical protein
LLVQVMNVRSSGKQGSPGCQHPRGRVSYNKGLTLNSFLCE